LLFFDSQFLLPVVTGGVAVRARGELANCVGTASLVEPSDDAALLAASMMTVWPLNSRGYLPRG